MGTPGKPASAVFPWGYSKVVAINSQKRVRQERELKCLMITFKYQDSFSTEKAIN